MIRFFLKRLLCLFLIGIGGHSGHTTEFLRQSWIDGSLHFNAGKPFGIVEVKFTTNVTNDGEVYFTHLEFETASRRLIIPNESLKPFKGILFRSFQAGIEGRNENVKACYAIEIRFFGRDAEFVNDLSIFPIVRIYVDEVDRVWTFESSSEGGIKINEIKHVRVIKKGR